MITINIILSTQEHGYLYEHGAELLGSIITTIAFIFTFIRMNIENNKDEKNEEEKNEKTLKMLDLISEKHIENIKNIRKELENAKGSIHIMIGVNNNKQTYQIDLKNIDSTNTMHIKKIYNTYSSDTYSILNSFKIIKENNTEKILEDYKDELTTVLSNQHINLNLKSLNKINSKINTLTSSLNNVKQMDDLINIIEASADEEINDPSYEKKEKIKEQEKGRKEWYGQEKEKKLNKLEDIKSDLKKAEHSLI
ncbi:hypothetical protein [Staphylococcus haemolyticus]|uniref:hypothetical protein n=1 Tax=Staphylococcus haemolyticus TaxID=1283 RepID=UPI001F0A93AB|nr:hypothetical protein [Staphylococcus haemolyticus]MCH4379948.1 hypothetical protein [Staphylococcus haemolyticus]